MSRNYIFIIISLQKRHNPCQSSEEMNGIKECRHYPWVVDPVTSKSGNSDIDPAPGPDPTITKTNPVALKVKQVPEVFRRLPSGWPAG